MARISGPSELLIPAVRVVVNEHVFPVLLPIDVPEGGFLHVVGGTSALLPAQHKLPLPAGAMVGVLDPEGTAKLVPQIAPAERPADESIGVTCTAFELGGLQFSVPLWLRIGGFLNVVVGENPMAMPTPSIPLPESCLVVVFAPGPAEVLRQGVRAEGRRARTPYAIIPGVNGGGL